MLGTFLIVGLLAVGGYILVDAAKTADAGDKLISDIDGVKFLGWESGRFPIEITFRHSNPTNTDLVFSFMYLDIYVDGQKLASIRQDSMNLKVERNKTSYQRIRAEVPLVGFAWSIAYLILAGQKPTKVTIKGPIKVGSYVTEYNDEYPLTIPFI